MNLSRRTFLTRAGGAALAPSLVGLAACNDLPTAPPAEADPSLSLHGRDRRVDVGGGYGPLAPSPDCPELMIPDGFRCVRLSETTRASRSGNGFVVPQGVDGMAAFPLRSDHIRLVRNHEIRDSAASSTPFGPNAYDNRAGGGTTSVELRVRRARRHDDIGEIEVLAEYPSLTGTHTNCAGGPTPWGSWLTCEETTEGTPDREQPHGYVFEVPSSATGPVDPVPLKALGRFVHEALAIDPRSGIVYLTEDRSIDAEGVGSGFYRFLPARGRGHDGRFDRGPHRGGRLSEGRLQVLAVEGRPNYDTSTGQTPGRVLQATWVDIADPDPSNAAEDTGAVFKQGMELGAAVFQRLEGCWYGDDSVFFNATSGGDVGAGQVWQYRPHGHGAGHRSGGQLILVFESPSVDVLESPDNITVSPRGGLVICEDGDGIQFLRGITRRGDIFDFVEQSEPLAEFAGACYSPDGELLFFNIQGSTNSSGTAFGATYAMWGPWRKGVL